MESRNLVAAGSDTSALAIAAATFYLALHHDVQRRLREELRTAFTDSAEIVSGPRLSACHYLRAFIDEVLRITPPVPGVLFREIEVPGHTVDGYHVPAGTEVGVSAYAIHHNADYFKDPHRFHPDRWLGERTAKDEIEAARSAFCPFSVGSRACIGRVMAYNELSIALGRLVWSFEIRMVKGDTGFGNKWGEYWTGDAFICERSGPVVQVKRVS